MARMSRHYSQELAIAAVGLSLLMTCVVISQNTRISIRSPPVWAEQPVVDIGDVRDGDEGDVAFVLKTECKCPITIQCVASSASGRFCNLDRLLVSESMPLTVQVHWFVRHNIAESRLRKWTYRIQTDSVDRAEVKLTVTARAVPGKRKEMNGTAP